MPRKALDLVKYHYQNLTYDHKHLPWLLVLFIFVNIFALSIGSFLPSGGSYFGVNVGVARAEADDGSSILLIHSDTTNGSTTFADSSTGGSTHTITANGDVVHSTTQAKFGGTSMYFDGTGDYLGVPASGDWQFGTEPFTLDAWIYVTSFPEPAQFMISDRAGDNTGDFWFGLTATGEIAFDGYNFPTILSSGAGIVTGQWYHMAAVREGLGAGQTKLYINGVNVVSGTNAANMSAYDYPLYVGANSGGTLRYINGYMDEVRVSKGVARWTSNFTPPTSKYEIPSGIAPEVLSGVDSDVKLMLHGDGVGQSFSDDSDSVHVITANGNATQSATQSKFGGKSMYFDGNGDYLSIPDSEDWHFAGENFTIDLWAYFTAVQPYAIFVAQMPTATGASGWVFRLNGTNGLRLDYNDGIVKNVAVTGFSPVINTWYHVAISKQGTNVMYFVNGNQIGTTQTLAGTIVNSPTSLAIARHTDGSYDGTFQFQGYLDELRISKGIARWTSNFTPPSAPYASVSISGNTVVGQTLTATYNYTDAENDPEGTSLYQWYRADTADGTYSAISGATNLTYTLGVNDYDKYIKYEVTPVSSIAPTTGSVVTSSAIGPIALNSVAPVATNVSVSGNILVGQKLTGSYTYSDAEGDAEGVSAFRWLRADTAGGTYVAISGATGLTYTLVSADNGKYIKFEVTPKAVNVPTNGVVVLSSATSQITATPVANLAPQVSAVNVSGSKLIGSVLTGNYVYSDYENDSQGASTFRWLRSDTIDGTYAPISEATGVTYSLTSADENKYIKFEVTPRSTTGTLVGVLTLSAAFGKVYSPLVVQQSFTQSTSTTIAIANTSVVGTATMPTSTIVIELKADQKLEFNDAVSAGVSAVNTTVTTPAGNVSIQAAMAEIMGSAFTETEVDSVQLNSGVAGEAIVISQGGMQVEIADATEIYAPASWDGTIQPPKVEQVTIPGKTTTSVISMGAPGISLVFTKPAKIVVPSSVGGPSYTVDGTNWINITTQCNTENGGGFSFPGECYYKSGQNTIIWTYHFTQFGMGSANLGLEFFNSYTGGISTTTVIGGDLEANGTSTLRILKGGVVYHLPVVATSSPYASSWRILVDGVVRAVKMFGWRTD